MSVEHEPGVERATQVGGQPLGVVPDESYYRRVEQTRRWGSFLVLIGVVWLVFSLSAQGSLFGFGFVERSENIAPQSFTAQRVVIKGGSDQVELVPTDGDTITLAGTRHGFGWGDGAAEDSLGRLEIVTDSSSGTLVIEVRRPDFSGIGRSPYAELRIALPGGVSAEANLVSGDMSVAGVRSDVELTTVSGDIEAENTAGALTVRTTSGEVRLSEHMGGLDVETVSGDVYADGALAAPRVKTVSGDVELDGVSGAVELRSISGDLSLRDAERSTLNVESTSGDVSFAGTLAGGASSRIGNISGDVDVELASPRDLRLAVTTASGDLESDLDLREARRERRELSGVLGDGTTGLTISTTSGDVAVTEE
jgi:DUF4097 and DUF4098 domain-containing protein YvlB